MNAAEIYKWLNVFGFLAITPAEVNNLLAPIVDIPTLKTLDVTFIGKGTLVYVESPGKLFQYDPTSTISSDDYDYVAPNVGPGNWITFEYSGLQTNQTVYQTATTFPAPMPRILYVFPITPGVHYTFPPFTEANGFKKNDIFIVVNVNASNDANLFNSAGVQVGYLPIGFSLQLFYVTATGTPGTLVGGIAWNNGLVQIPESQVNNLVSDLTTITSAIATLNTEVAAITPGYLTVTSGSNIVLNNPGAGPLVATTLMDISLAAPGLSMSMPPMNASPFAVGTIFAIRNPSGNVNSFAVYNSLGGLLVPVLKPRQWLILELIDKSSAAGVYRLPRITGELGGGNGIADLDASALLNVARMPAFSGDVTVPAGSTVATLPNVLSSPGGFGDVQHTLILTANTKGLVTALASVAIALASNQITDKNAANGVAGLDAGAHLLAALFPALSGDVTTTAGSLVTALTAILTAGSAGTNGYQYPGITWDAKGRLTAVTNQSIVNQKLNETTAARTLAVSDINAIINCTFLSSDTTITIPTHASVPIPVGAIITLINDNGTSNFNVKVAMQGGVAVDWAYPLVVGNQGRITIQQVAADFWRVVDIYEEASFTWSWGSGLFAAAINATFSVVRERGNVTLRFPQIISTVGAPGAAGPNLTSATTLPTRFCPPANVYDTAIADFSTATQNTPGRLLVQSSGNIIFTATNNGLVNFPAGTSGVYESSISYNVI